jgi:hypothetical protein
LSLPSFTALTATPPPPAHLADPSLNNVVGEEEVVAGRFFEVVGVEALVDLGREELFSLVELHDVTGVECDRIERCSHPLLAGLLGHVRHLLSARLVTSAPPRGPPKHRIRMAAGPGNERQRHQWRLEHFGGDRTRERSLVLASDRTSVTRSDRGARTCVEAPTRRARALLGRIRGYSNSRTHGCSDLSRSLFTRSAPLVSPRRERHGTSAGMFCSFGLWR